MRICRSETLPSNRALLRDLHTTDDNHHVGEGTVVQIIGFLIKGKYSNVGKNKGESVNRHFEDREENDIHMNIVKTKPPESPTKTQLETLECESVIAEVSPHFRPELWEPLGRLVKTTAKATAAKKIAALDLDRPMRFAGQAFFDASHRPCVNGKPQESSKRVSSWEVHPVYRIEVCLNSSLSGCAPDRTDVWVSLDEWLTADEEEDGDSGDLLNGVGRLRPVSAVTTHGHISTSRQAGR